MTNEKKAMSDKELADHVVALRIGKLEYNKYWIYDKSCEWSQWDGPVSADIFIRDWRVAGALLTMVYDAYANIHDVVQTFEGHPRAIIEDCVEAL